MLKQAESFNHNNLCLAKDMLNEGNLDRAYALFAEALSSMEKEGYSGQDHYDVLNTIIALTYKLNKKEDAYKFIALLLLTEQAKQNTCYCLFDVAKTAYDANDTLFAKGLIKAIYQASDGSYFAEPDLKKYLEFVGIQDDRTFEDYSQDY